MKKKYFKITPSHYVVQTIMPDERKFETHIHFEGNTTIDLIEVYTHNISEKFEIDYNQFFYECSSKIAIVQKTLFE